MQCTVSIDLGGTTFSFVIFSDNQIIYKSKMYDIKIYTDYNVFFLYLTSLIKEQLNGTKIDIIGIACPGPLNSETGEILNTPNLTFLQYINLKTEINKYIKCNAVLIENDANVYALGSYYSFIHNKDTSITNVLLGITLGTGIGFGIIIDGKLFKGSYGMAGEYELSPLGNKITWADLIGYKFFRNKSDFTPKELFDLAENGDIDAINIWNEYGLNIGMCLSHVIGIINPNCISIGGGISKANKFFHNSMYNYLLQNCLISDKYKINIIYDKESLYIYYGILYIKNKNNI